MARDCSTIQPPRTLVSLAAPSSIAKGESMNRRSFAILCAASPLAAILPAQTAQPSPPSSAPSPAAGNQPPRSTPAPYKPVVPPTPGDLSVWPRGVSPDVVGKALAEHFLTGAQAERFSGYTYVCTFYGAMIFAELTQIGRASCRVRVVS